MLKAIFASICFRVRMYKELKRSEALRPFLGDELADLLLIGRIRQIITGKE